MTAPGADALRAVHAEARGAVRRLRLPLRGKFWRGLNGNVPGTGAGSSIDFQDHRPYLPGDDPRYIDWQAYARSGNYTMKLYREEVAPRVDVAMDVSASMRCGEGKERLAWALWYFCAESTAMCGGALRLYARDGESFSPLLAEATWGYAPLEGGVLRPGPIPWRQGSLRVWISDLLEPGVPEAAVADLVGNRGRAIVLAPSSVEEEEPDWAGNVEFEDVESGTISVRHVGADVLAGYRAAYARHFGLWADCCRKRGAVMARMRGGVPLDETLVAGALPVGAVEMTQA